jgi:hypothetical protein
MGSDGAEVPIAVLAVTAIEYRRAETRGRIVQPAPEFAEQDHPPGDAVAV